MHIFSDYAAPEGCQVNQRYSSDIYSFGVIVLEIVSGWKHRVSKQHLNLIAYVSLELQLENME